MAILSWLAAPAHSLNEVAQKEAFRRQLLPKAKVSVSGTGMPGGAVPPSPTPASTAAAPAAASANTPPNAAADHRTDESWWRKRFADAHAALDRDQASAEALQTKINGLQRDVVNHDNPIQQGKLRDDLTKALADLEKAKTQITDDQTAIQSIQDEARRMDVPPGWVR
jgi:hypothetical protein